MPMPSRPLDHTLGIGGSNSDYVDVFTNFLTSSTLSTEADFGRYFEQFKGGYHGASLACNTTGAKFSDCATCTRDCRVAFVCLQMAGTQEQTYVKCVQEHAVDPSQ